MNRKTNYFELTPPPDWGESTEGSRLVYRSPRGEVLMVSSAAIEGHGERVELDQLKEKFLQNAFNSLTSSTRHPDLKITKPLGADGRTQGVECWTIEAETTDGQEVYLQSVCRNDLGILFITFEGYNSATAKSEYERFIRSIRPLN